MFLKHAFLKYSTYVRTCCFASSIPSKTLSRLSLKWERMIKLTTRTFTVCAWTWVTYSVRVSRAERNPFGFLTCERKRDKICGVTEQKKCTCTCGGVVYDGGSNTASPPLSLPSPLHCPPTQLRCKVPCLKHWRSACNPSGPQTTHRWYRPTWWI